MPDADDDLIRELPDGWTIHVRGDARDDDGWSGGHGGGNASYFGLPGASVQEMIALLDAQRAEDEREAATPRELVVRLTRGDVDVTVIDESRLPAEGPATLLWPASVVPDGVVLRLLRTTTLFVRADKQPLGPGQAPRQDEWAAQPGLLVRTDGTVEALPFELSVSPIAVAPDGRLLMPSHHPLWWDGANESVTLLALDGASEPLIADGAPITPARVLDAIGEPHCNVSDDGRDGPHWTIRQARFDGDDLTLRLVHDEASYDDALEHDQEWVTVTVPLVGRWAVRRRGTGTLLDDAPLPPL